MLDLDTIDLDMLCMALEDHSPETSWWLNPLSGEVLRHDPDVDDETVDDLDDSGLIVVEPTSSSVSYRDMEEFVAAVPQRSARDQLARAIEGRGAFRRFKDALFELPELRDQWFAFHDARVRRRALEWLRELGVVVPAVASAAIDASADPPVGDVAGGLPREIALDLRQLYGSRLVDVYVFGSRARGDADEDSDLDLVVVLDRVDDPWEEHERMEETLWRHTLASGVVVSAVPVAEERFEHPDAPVLIRAKAEGIRAA